MFFEEASVKICYIDEAGCLGSLPSATSDIQPAFVLTGLFIDQSRIHDLTLEFLHIKNQYFPHTSTAARLDSIRCEVKGADLRTDIRLANSNQKRLVISYLISIVLLLKKHNAQFVSKVWIKGIGKDFKGRSIYTSSMQAMCGYFQHYLEHENDEGLIIADARNKGQNSIVSHSIFTKKFQYPDDAYPQLIEMPTFGHAENHVGLQLTDTLCSALVFPLAIHAYCEGYVNSVHVSEHYHMLKRHFSERLYSLRYRYRDSGGQWAGGITVFDGILKRPGSLLFT